MWCGRRAMNGACASASASETSRARPADIDDLVAQAKRAEADGFASGWFANIFGMDAIIAAAVCGRETTRIELGTAVVPTYPRHPVAMAQAALSAAGGRARALHASASGCRTRS